MSRKAEVILEWGDGEYPFSLKIEQLAELQEVCDAGPWYIQWALQMSILSREMGIAPPKEASPKYVIDTIRLGLIGGGMPAVEALKKVRAYAGAGQINDNISTAFAVISVALQGAPDDEPGKPEAGSETDGHRSREERSDSQKSTEAEPPLD